MVEGLPKADQKAILHYIKMMVKNIEEIKQAVIHLPPEDLAAFRRWYQEYDASAWDKQFEDDVKSGKLDFLAQQAVNDLKAGKCKDL